MFVFLFGLCVGRPEIVHLHLIDIILADFVTDACLAAFKFEGLLAISHLVTVFLKPLLLTILF